MSKSAARRVSRRTRGVRRPADVLSERRLRRWLSVLSVCARRRRRGPGWAGSAGAFSALTMFAGLHRALIALCWYGGW